MTEAGGGALEIPGYRDVTVVGRGASSTVFRAHDVELSRPVAIKVLLADDPDDPARRRFKREGVITANLGRHPHIVQVLGTGFTDDGHPYVVMELFEQGSIADRLRTAGTFSVPETLDIGAKVADAVSAAHRAGVLHRDIKPQNVLLSEYGPALGDFGIARTTTNLEWSQSLDQLTPMHAAPEILSGGTSTVQSDVYSLGSTLYTMLSGRPPFAGPSGESPLRYQLRVLQEPVPPIPRADVGEAVMAVLERALAKSPGDRFASAAELHDALEAPLRALGATADEGGGTAGPTGRPVRGGGVPSFLSVSASPGNAPVTSSHVTSSAVMPAPAETPATSAPPSSTGTSGSGSAPVAVVHPEPPPSRTGPIVDTAPSDDGAVTVRRQIGAPAGAPEPAPPTGRRRGRRVLVAAAALVVLVGAVAGAVVLTRSPSSRRLSVTSGGRASLASLQVRPTTLSLAVGGTARLALSGTTSRHTAAPKSALGGIVWTSTDPHVATVTHGTVIAFAAGSTIITGQDGTITARLAVAVTAPSSTTTTTQPAPEGSSVLGSGSGSAASNGAGTSGHTTPVTTPTTRQTTTTTTPQTVPQTTPSITVPTTRTTAPQTTTTTSTTVPVDAVGCPISVCVRSPDINGDGVVNCADLAILRNEWGMTGPDLPADLNGDGVVDLTDLGILSAYWTPGQPTSCSTDSP